MQQRSKIHMSHDQLPFYHHCTLTIGYTTPRSILRKSAVFQAKKLHHHPIRANSNIFGREHRTPTLNASIEMPAPSLPPQQHGSSPSSPNPPLPSHLTWTIAHEERLVYVQRHLTAAQAAWSEDQDLWIDEVWDPHISFSRSCYFHPPTWLRALMARRRTLWFLFADVSIV